jgi:hypothetical protein
MSTIHELSSVLALPELDIFGVPPTQLMVDSDVQTEHRPVSTVTNAISPIDFEIHTGLDEYINLCKSELYLCVKIHLEKLDKTAVKADDWKNICPVNYLLNSMFKQIKVSIGQTTVTSTSLNYAYVAYLDGLINIDKWKQLTHLQTAFWHKDTSESMDKINENRSLRLRPIDGDLSKSCELEMYGNLHIDLGDQIKSLLGGITLSITLIPNDPKFYLLHDNNLIPKVEIMDVRYYIHRSKLTPQVVIAHNKALEIANSRYFITRKEVKSFIIQKGSIDCYLNNVENGVIPRKVYVGLVSNEAFNGSGQLNPFNFKHYNLRFIACYLDGCQYPHRPYTPDFKTNKYLREYFGLFETSNQVKGLTLIDIKRKEFKEGFTIFGFNFIPDLADSFAKSGYVSPLKRGNLRIELKFSDPLPETVSAIVFCEYDNLVEIPNSRTALKDFN